MDSGSDAGTRDFFVSYTLPIAPWAEWIAWQLESVGHTTLLQAWDFRPGSDFVHQMQQATATAARTIAVLSPAYFGSRFGEAEWRAAFAEDPTGERGLLIPVRVATVDVPGLLASRVYIDLVGKTLRPSDKHCWQESSSDGPNQAKNHTFPVSVPMCLRRAQPFLARPVAQLVKRPLKLSMPQNRFCRTLVRRFKPAASAMKILMCISSRPSQVDSEPGY